MPTGTIGAPVRSASTATPSRAAWSAPSRLRVPSGNTNRTWPSSRIRLASRIGLDVGRRSDRPGGRRRGGPSSRRSASRTAPSCRATGSAGRASGMSYEPSTTASRFEAWLAAMMTGPSRGIASSAPSTRIAGQPGQADRESPRASVAISGGECRRRVGVTGRLLTAARAGSVAGRGSRGAGLGVADRADDGRDGLLERVAVGRDDPGVRRRCAAARPRGSRRGGRAGAGPRGSPAPPGRPGRARAPRSGAGRAPRPRRRGKLEVGVGQHDRADVAAGHDDPAARRPGRAGAASRAARTSATAETADTAASTAGLRTSSVWSTPSTTTRASRPVASGASSTSSTSADEALRIVDRHAASLGQPGHRAVQQARVAEAVADLARGGRADAALARRARPVEGDDESVIRPRIAVSARRRLSDGGGHAPGRVARATDRPPAPRPRTSGAFSGRTGRCAGRRCGPGRCGRGRGARPAHRPPRTSGAAGASSPGSASRGTRSGRPAASAAAASASRSTSIRVIGRRRAERRQALVERDPGAAAPRPARRSSGVAEPERVLALDAVARMQDPLGPAAVVGQQEQALGVLVEAPDRVEPGAVGHERGRARGRGRSCRRGGRASSRSRPAGLWSSR